MTKIKSKEPTITSRKESCIETEEIIITRKKEIIFKEIKEPELKSK